MSSQKLAHAAAAIAVDAAAAILRVYQTDFDVEKKEDRSPLTEADLAAHHVIVDGLRALTPNVPILSEESAALAWEQRRLWTRYWLVDPLDGTREFIKRNGEFTVNIALIDEHRPVVGIVQTPVTGELAIAWDGGGCWLSRDGAPLLQITTRSRPVPLVVAGSRSHGDARLAGMIEQLGSHELLAMGSSLKFVRIAAGEADLYVRLGLTSEWDTAAGQCLVEQAGGMVCQLDGEPLRYNGKDSLLNPEFIVAGDAGHDWAALLGTRVP